MAEAGDKRPLGTDENGTEERRAQGSTVAALNSFSADVAEGTRAGLGYPEPEDAIKALAAAVANDTLRVPRLSVLDSLVRLASGRPEALRAHEAALNTLIEALVRQARGPEADMGDAPPTVRDALDSVARLSGIALAHPWQVFAQQAAGPLRLTQAEIEKPLCNDTERVVKGDYEAVGVTVEFQTDASPGELRHFCDPTRWHECSAHQKEMTPWDDPGAIDEQGPGPNGWRCDLLERVQLSPAKLLETPLRFTYGIQEPSDPDWVHLDYLLLEKTEDILVDEGALDVRRVTSGKDRGRTRVSAKKAILFKGLLAQWPTVACDTFWMDQVIVAAVGCPDPESPLHSPAGKPAMADSKEAPLDKAIDDATVAAQTSIDTYARLAKKAAAQLSGDSPADTDRWLELTTKTWAQAARDTAQAWTTYNAMLQALATTGERGAEHPESGGTEIEHPESEDDGPGP